MTGITLSTEQLNQAIESSNQLAVAIGATLSGNMAWFLLFATLIFIVTFIQFLARKVVKLGSL